MESEDCNEHRYLFEQAPDSRRRAEISGITPSSSTKPMSYDAILQTVGQFGPLQVRTCFVLCLSAAITVMLIMSSIFTLIEPKHRCAVPGLKNDTYVVQGPWHRALINTTIPPGSECEVYDLTNTSGSGLDPGAGNKSLTTEKCDRWVYDESQFESSIITEFDLVCGKTYARASINMGLFAGSVVGSFISGILADVIGRKPTMLILALLNGASSVTLTFMPDLESVIVMHCIQGLSMRLAATAIVTGMELVGPDRRTAAGIGYQFAWVMGEIFVLPLAYVAQNWRIVYLVIGLVAFAVAIATSFIPESPRWLIDKGRFREAHRIMQKIAKSNKKPFASDIISKGMVAESPKVQVWALFGHRKLIIRAVIIFFDWFVVNFLYYGLSLNLDNLPGNIYTNYLIASLSEGAAYAIALIFLDRLGRKGLFTTSMMLAGLACLMAVLPVIFLPADYSWLFTALTMLGRLAVCCSFGTVVIMTVELFPTVVRTSGFAFCAIFEFSAGLGAPYVADLGQVVGGNLSQVLPMLVFGSLALMSSALSTQLPETLGRDLPETIDDAINIDKN